MGAHVHAPLLPEGGSGLRVVRLEPCGWSDWGTPQRVLDSLRGDREFHVLSRRIEAAEQRAALAALPAAALIC